MIPFVLISFLAVQTNALFGDLLLKSNPATGPCILNNDGLKCSKTGYYETVQCDENSCYCVTPHNAIVAYDTRTTSSRIAPKCGACYTYLQRLFANGDPPDRTFIPKCDVSKGDFEHVQCESRDNRCYCVNTSTGQEIPGTRTTLNNTKKMNCMKIEFSIDPVRFPEFIKPDPSKVDQNVVVGRQSCLQNRDPGVICNKNRPTVKYWFDKQTFLCLPFLYKGCGGNDNVYNTRSECYSDCVLADYSSCGLQTPPARKSDGSYYVCGNFGSPIPPPGQKITTTPGPVLKDDGCPKGYICQMGAFFGTCCNEAISIKFNAAFKPECKNKKKTLLDKTEDFTRALLGKSCGDDFCPTNHTCEHNGIFAFCCPK